MLDRRDEPDEADDGRRTTVNLVAAIVCLLLLGAGLFLVESMDRARKAQNCFEAGRRNCAALSTP
ncbi:hypothetical protein SLNSH_21325 [Alsobacter soli]|uniref:Uncharacterized protein n=1 Tax=Alsobacter soli TaxID=2109933 RepID=A0A2T1HMT0_9HYPH|nr:hypothetical protein [Alsobacter soli]PSC02932.1 hypothetical protein SLNSH_21325 [Alsobacter soli]